jgi:thiaminase/transcriptional activator TenA
VSDSLARRLWVANDDLAQAALNHRFVRGLADGSLPPAAFRAYIVQDAYFLDAFARAYALALARVPDRASLREFFELIGGVLDELQLHGGYARRWGVDPASSEPAAATLAYTHFLLATATLTSVGETCAAMTPCMRLYAFLGQSLATAQSVADNPYQDWIATYASAPFEALAARLEHLLDRYGSDSPSIRTVYRQAMTLELAFFEAAR